jgi:hypothetical protein
MTIRKKRAERIPRNGQEDMNTKTGTPYSRKIHHTENMEKILSKMCA